MKNITLENRVRNMALIACEVFTLITLILLLCRQDDRQDYKMLLLCIATFALLLIPTAVERGFSCRIRMNVYLFGLAYALGPMLGDCYKLYYSTTWWDKLLHISGGVMFALFGLYLFGFLSGKNKRLLACALFAVCFSVTLSVLWEFIEFGCDQLFGTDMQRDTVISSIHSYSLSTELGTVESIENIEMVTVNGDRLPVNGYLDIGLIDSMTDMLFESLGAFLVSILYLLDKGRHPAFVMRRKGAEK